MMTELPYRTGSTSLTDNQLLLLDVLFDLRVEFRGLSRLGFQERWNLGYSHTLDDTALARDLKWLCDYGALDTVDERESLWFRMTRRGGELWSLERCPIWEKYCIDEYKITSSGRTIMSVKAITPEVRDNFLAICTPFAARRKSKVVADPPLIEWQTFPKVYVGLALYPVDNQGRSLEYALGADNTGRLARIDHERSWWRSVKELQRFLSPSFR